jgi:hypothetical protein
MICLNYKSFEDWYNELDGNVLRSQKILTNINCPDPFKKPIILKEWLKTAWEMGYNTAVSSNQRNFNG